MSEIRVVIADDHAVVRAGLKLILDAEDGMTVVAEAGAIDETRRRVSAYKPDVLVLDLNMPGEPSLAAIPELATRTAIVVLTMQDDPAFAREALQHGARAYVLKEAADAELVDAVRHAAAGEVYVASQLPAVAPVARLAARRDNLTSRELEVLRLIAMGHTNGEIATRLVLSVRTVESHRAHIQAKLGRSSRAELTRYALDHHLLAA